MFTKEELAVVDTLAKGKKLAETDDDHVESLKEKLGTSARAEIPGRFVAVTGWANPAKDYPA